MEDLHEYEVLRRYQNEAKLAAAKERDEQIKEKT
jgi:hypothetical protein